MKNKLKYLALLLILPVAFVFTACGSQLDADAQVNTGKESKYEVTTQAELSTYLEGLEKDEDENAMLPTGAKVTVTFDAGDMANGKVNIIFKTTKTEEGKENVELAARADVKAKAGTNEAKAKGDIYFKENVIYFDMNAEAKVNVTGLDSKTEINGKYKIDLSTDTGFGTLFGILMMAQSFLPTEDLPVDLDDLIWGGYDLDILAELPETMNMEVKVSSYTDGGFKRFKIVAEDDEAVNTVTAYLVFNKDVLVGVKVDAKMTQDEQEMKLSLALESFAGDIDYPDFKDYADFDASSMMGNLM